MSDVDHCPRLFYLFAERSDGSLVFLRELEGRLNLGRIVDDLAVELATFLNQALLLLVRFLQCPVQLFVLKPLLRPRDIRTTCGIGEESCTRLPHRTATHTSSSSTLRIYTP